MFSLNPGIWSHNWLSKSLSRQRGGRGGGPQRACCYRPTLWSVTLRAAQFMDHGQFIRSNVVYQRGRGTEHGRESFQSRKPCFRIIYAMMKMFPPWPEMAVSTSGHLYSNQKRRSARVSWHNSSFLHQAPVKCSNCVVLSVRSLSKTLFWCIQALTEYRVNFFLKVSEKTSGQNFRNVSDFLIFHWGTKKKKYHLIM